MNYAKSQPDLAILSVNAFVKDAQDRNPLIRALAVRTMGCIRVDRIVEYLCVLLKTEIFKKTARRFPTTKNERLRQDCSAVRGAWGHQYI